MTVLGAGTLVPSAERHSAAHHVRLDRASVLFDCGPGTVHGFAQHGVDWRDLTHVVISHYHTDHVGDLSALLFAFKHAVGAARTEPLTLVGPVGFERFVRGLSAAMGDHLLRPGFEVRIVEVAPDGPLVEEMAGFGLEACPTPHTEESLAYRLRGEWGGVGYTGDTGPSHDVASFLEGCQVLVAECALTDPPEMDLHLSPLGLAEMARTARPGLLVITHVYPPQTPEGAAARVAEHYEGPVVAATDGLAITLGPEGPAVDPGSTAAYT